MLCSVTLKHVYFCMGYCNVLLTVRRASCKQIELFPAYPRRYQIRHIFLYHRVPTSPGKAWFEINVIYLHQPGNTCKYVNRHYFSCNLWKAKAGKLINGNTFWFLTCMNRSHIAFELLCDSFSSAAKYMLIMQFNTQLNLWQTLWRAYVWNESRILTSLLCHVYAYRWSALILFKLRRPEAILS